MSTNGWKDLLANPGPDGHIVQLYQDEDFYGEAISHFAAEGLVRGESIILVATDPNWRNIAPRLESKGFHIPDLFSRGRPSIARAVVHPAIPTGGMTDADLVGLRMKVHAVIEAPLIQTYGNSK